MDEWDPDFKNYLQTLDKEKPIILCGDLNVAHNEIGKRRGYIDIVSHFYFVLM